MCRNAADIGEICRRHRVQPVDFLAGIPALPALIEDGLAEFEGERLRITDLGRPLVRCVCAAFDRHWPGSTGRHSRAI